MKKKRRSPTVSIIVIWSIELLGVYAYAALKLPRAGGTFSVQ
jgi:hypothetical protein